MAGTTSRIALLSASIFPFSDIDPEQSSNQMICSGRLAYSPPGLSAICVSPLVIRALFFGSSALRCDRLRQLELDDRFRLHFHRGGLARDRTRCATGDCASSGAFARMFEEMADNRASSGADRGSDTGPLRSLRGLRRALNGLKSSNVVVVAARGNLHQLKLQLGFAGELARLID